MINENAIEEAKRYGLKIIEGTQAPKSMIFVPFGTGTRVNGYFSLQNMERENAFAESDVRLLQTLAGSMGIALENARLSEEIQNELSQQIQAKEREEHRRLILEKVITTGQHVTEVHDVRTTLMRIWHGVHDDLGFDRLGLYLFNPERNSMDGTFGTNNQGEMIDEWHTWISLENDTEEARFFLRVIEKPDTILLTHTYESDYNIPEGHIMSGVQDFAAIGAWAGTKPVAVICVDHQITGRRITEEQLEALRLFAGYAGLALENARLFDETQRLLKETEQRAQELAAISTVSQALVAETELDNMIQLIGSQMREIFEADLVYVALLDRQTNLIHFPYQIGEEFTSLKLGEGLTSKIIQTGEPLLINKDIKERRKEMGTTLVGKESLSYLGVPIKSGRESIGVLSVQSTQQEGMFNEDSLRLLTTIAANAGAAIHTAQLHAETQRRAQEMATLAEIGNDIAATRELEPVLEKIAAHAKSILRVRDIAMYLREGDTDTFRTSVALGTYTEEIKANPVTSGTGITGNIAKSGVAEFVNYPVRDPRVTHVAGTPLEDDENEAIMVAPLISRGETIGILAVWRPHVDGLFTQPDLDFLISVARQTAIAIESARLYLETQRRAREMSALVDVGRDISASLECIYGAARDRHTCQGFAQR